MRRRWQDDQFTAVYQALFAELSRFLSALLNDQALAADLTQESFLRLHRQDPAKFEDRETCRFWLLRVAKNLALNEIRKTATRERLINLFTLGGHQAAKDPELEYMAQEKSRFLLGCMNALHPRQRMILLLREQQGLSYEDIAHCLQSSLSKVKSDLFRARQALHQLAEKRKEPQNIAGTVIRTRRNS